MSKVLLCYEDFSELMSMQSILKKVGFDVLPISSEFSLSQQILQFNPEIVVAYGKGPKVSTLGVGRRMKEMPRWNGRVVLVFPAGAKPKPDELSSIRMDMALEAPLEITRLIQVLANLTAQDPQAMIERMLRGVAEEAEEAIRTGGQGSAAPAGDEALFVTGAKEEEAKWTVQGGSELDQFDEMIRGRQSEEPAVLPAAESAPAPSEDEIAARSVQAQLAEAELKVHDKVKGYEKYIASPPPSPQAALKRTETRKAQKDLQKGWSEAALKNQDELRREFADALFKKKN